MNKREFLKTGLIGSLALFSLPVLGKTGINKRVGKKIFRIPDLTFELNALEPFIDEETMREHYLGHHNNYAIKLTEEVNNAGITGKGIREILRKISVYNVNIRNNGGAFLNHRIFWKILTPQGGDMPVNELAEAIKRDFGSFEVFKASFSLASLQLHTQGWTWLVLSDRKLKIVTTTNHDNPLMDVLPPHERGVPMLCLDLWKHAYRRKYQDNRSEYVDAFWNFVDWKAVNKRYLNNI